MQTLSPVADTTPPARKCCSVGGIKAQVCPFAVNRSRFGLRYSRVRGRRQSKFLASSSTGGARNFYPCTGEARVALKTLGAKLAQGRQEKFAIAAAKGQKNWLAPFGASMLYICLTGLFCFLPIPFPLRENIFAGGCAWRRKKAACRHRRPPGRR